MKYVLERISRTLNLVSSEFIYSNSKFEAVILDQDTRIFLVDEEPDFIECGNEILPTLINERILSKFSALTVNMGAIPHICNGADIMAPGVTKVSGFFTVGQLIVILEEKFSKKIAIARALSNSSEIGEKKQGKVAENLHYIGDRFWKAIKP